MSRILSYFLPALIVTLSLQVALAQEEELRTARVTYFTGSTIYIDAGREEGLTPGLRLVVKRGSTVVAVVEVKDVSAHRASCSIVERTQDPEVGDELQFRAQAPAPPGPATTAAAAIDTAGQPSRTPKKRAGPRGSGVRGRVGLRYLVVNDRLSDTGGFSQPALDLRLDGMNLGGTAWGFAVDARARRTYRDLSDGTSDDESRTRLYSLAVMRRGIRDRWGFTAGRQFSPALAAVSIFDGLSADYRGQRWSLGGFSGTQPDPVDFEYSDEIREHGLYFQYHGRPARGRSWQVTTGLIGSYQESEVNREFLYLQGRYNGPRLAAYLAQEVDYNRDWKEEEAGEDTVEPTSTFASLRYRVGTAVELHGGYDNRRNVRLYRDRVTPVTEFDDEFRQGVWAGASFYILDRYRFGLDARTNGGGTAGNSDSYSLIFGASRLTQANVNVHTRAASYTNDQVEGWLLSLDAGVNLGQRIYLQLFGGVRDEDNLAFVPPENTLHWYGLDVDFNLGRHWYLLISAERTDGDLEEIDQYYSTASYRF
jgi:hypothetical protein